MTIAEAYKKVDKYLSSESQSPIIVDLPSAKDLSEFKTHYHVGKNRFVGSHKYAIKDNLPDMFEQMDKFGVGEPNPWGTYFTGASFLRTLTEEGCAVPAFNVTFEPGCRNCWHIHHASKGGGQVLICTAGEGWYQEWGSPAVSLEPGTVITIDYDGNGLIAR